MSCKFGTGQTIHDIILSVNNKLQPISATTFEIDVYRFGVPYTGITVDMTLVDPSTAAFSSAWSADTIGDYQIVYRNEVTTAFFITDVYKIVSDSDLSTNVYVGL